MLLQDILKAKGSTVYWIAPDATLADAVRELVAHHVGALLVGQPDPDGGLACWASSPSAICSTPMPASAATSSPSRPGPGGNVPLDGLQGRRPDDQRT